jgi:AcrR family transcriptional regulator
MWLSAEMGLRIITVLLARVLNSYAQSERTPALPEVSDGAARPAVFCCGPVMPSRPTPVLQIVAERRRGSDMRRAEIVAATASLVEAQGFLPLPVEQIARAAGVSRGLVYAHFADQRSLCNAVIAELLTPLDERIARIRLRRFESLSAAFARAYFDHVAAHGVVLHTLFTDPQLEVEPAMLAMRDAVLRRLLRAARGYAPLTPRQQTAALAIVLSVVEEVGLTARRREMETHRARALCDQLVLSALRGLRDVR